MSGLVRLISFTFRLAMVGSLREVPGLEAEGEYQLHFMENPEHFSCCLSSPHPQMFADDLLCGRRRFLSN